MSVADQVADIGRLEDELASHRAQREKIVDKYGKKDAKVGAVDATIAETQAALRAATAELPDGATGHVDKLRKAQASLDSVRAALTADFPPATTLPDAVGAGAAYDATVATKES